MRGARGIARILMSRLDRCPFGEEKPTCAACPIHCYKADRRQRIRKVMRYAGPRMLWHHPWSALLHLWDARRAAAQPGRKKTTAPVSAKDSSEQP